jgi:hypothetical protein
MRVKENVMSNPTGSLLYRIDPALNKVVFERTGTHSGLVT